MIVTVTVIVMAITKVQAELNAVQYIKGGGDILVTHYTNNSDNYNDSDSDSDSDGNYKSTS